MVNWFTESPLRAVVVIIASLVGIVIVFGVVMSVLSVSGGPGECTPGGGAITVSDANADSFDRKWDEMDAILDGGSPASITLDESEISSRADRYFSEEHVLDVTDIRICIHDGYGEATGTAEAVLGLEVEARLEGTVDLSGDSPKIEIDDIEIGSVPGGLVDLTDDIFVGLESEINEALEDITLKHTYTATLTEGQVQIDGTP
jgi:hypothetical protein